METVKSKSSFLGERSFSLKWRLVFLITGVLLPFALFAFIVTYKSSMDEQADAQRRLLANARSLNETLEREFSASVRTLQSLATSKNLDQNNLPEFYEEAKRIKATQPTWLAVVLISRDGKPLINTRYEFGAALPPVGEPASFQKVLQTKESTIGSVFRGENISAFPIRVPVLRNNELHYVLTAVITTDSLTEILKKSASRNTEWTRTIVDGNGYIAARTRDPEKFVGGKSSEEFLQQTSATPEGVFRNTSLDNVQVYVGFVRDPNTNWVASVVVHSDMIDDLGVRAIGFVIALGIALLLFSCLGAYFLSRRISREIVASATAAQQLVQGKPLDIKTSNIQEVKQLNEALVFSSRMLAQRQEEQEKHLAESEEARAMAESANKLKDEFLITVSHELRTPLNSILGWITLLRSGRFTGEPEKAHEIIERNARSQTKLIEDLLDVSRIITGKLNLEAQNVNLVEVVKNAIDSTSHAAESKDIKLEFEHEVQDVPIVGDPNRLQQIVWNLISNAVKFTEPGGRIIVELIKKDKECQIVVSDTGKGINKEFLPFVFDRFRQADGSTKRMYGGLGLGLAIVKHLAELHGGSVKADSLGEGTGATFTVSLPLKQKELAESNSANGLAFAEQNQNQLKGVKVLVVDDEPDTRELVQSLLSQQGAEVRTSGSVSDALLEIKKWSPTIVLSDIGMPHEDGFDFIRHLKELEASIGQKIPAAALTAYTRPEDRTKVLSAGYIKHISKPIDSLELIGVVARLVNGNN